MHIQDFSRYHFRGQRDGEKILRVIHRHWFNIVMHFFLVSVFSLLVFGSGYVFLALFPTLMDPKYSIFFVFFQNTFLLLLWFYAFLIWIDYYFDVWIITDERVVNIEQKGLFVRKVSELKFARIQDVTSEVNGFIPTLFNFGDLKIQTAGEEELFLFRQVPDPYEIKDLLMERLRNDRDEELRQIAGAVRLGSQPSR